MRVLSEAWEKSLGDTVGIRSSDGAVHATLLDSLHADPVQALVQRTSWASPIVQFQPSVLPGKPHVLRVGSLGYRWVPEEHKEAQQRDFLALVDQLFRGLQLVTRAKRVCVYDGSLVPVVLGHAAEDRARLGGVSLREQNHRYRVLNAEGPGTAVDWDDEL